MDSNYKSKVAMSEIRSGLEAPIVISEIADRCLYSGFFGRLDSRMKEITDKMLSTIEHTNTDYIIIDLASVEFIDSAVATHLIQIGNTLKLVGIKVVFCGIKSVVAQTMTIAGVEFDKFHISRDLKSH